MLRNVFKRLVLFASAPAHSERSTVDAADRLILAGRQAEDAGNLREACERYREAVAIAPQHAPVHLHLGVVLEAAGDADGALQCYEAVLAIDRGNAYANYNLGKLLYVRREFAQAVRHLRTALERKPEFPEAQVILANLLQARGDAAGAATAFEVALRQRPEDFGTWFGYGMLLRKLGRERDAESALARAASIDPANSDAHAALFDLLHLRGDLAAAVLHLEAVLKQQPDWVDALHNYGTVLMRMQRLEEAEAAFRRVIDLDPHHALAYRMLGNVLHRRGRIGELLDVCGTGRACNPERFEIESFELFALNFVDTVSPEELFARHRTFGARLEKATAPRFLPFGNSRDPDRRLRIGYVSGDYSCHPVSLFMIPLIERHDRSRFQVHCYSVGAATDAITLTVKDAADVWRDARAMSESALADAVHGDGIDILVDLSGHSGTSRLGTFAHQPAPVQAAWLGYLNTTGLTRIQYRISDAICDPPGLTDRLHTEELVRLPRIQWCYRPLVTLPIARDAPLDTNPFVTFGAFTQIAKLTAPMRLLWAQILQQTPNARLVVVGVADGRARAELLEALVQDGVHPSRVVLLPFMPVQDYLRWFSNVDIALDTSPYSGGTTTCDALWMGVPVLTIPGSRSTSRSAASILTTMGLTDWIATSPEDYVGRAVQFASERETIVGLRHSLRERMQASPLMQEARFALDIERAYREMWHKWCSGGRL